ncbi:aminoacyl-histidine dipeptidase [Bhargavaea cecembensis]|uniref:aminoacyl-histidine dipeptidase n=1 Tax=Bhargavaea cecembensis TaxID=394098 RepID=UPI000694A15B|nr:aminoacyl-histidine dipeptidase [Bhargavaea cecembensis]
METERVLENIEPYEVFHFFEDLTQIPRCSGKEEQVVAYLIDFAESHGLDWQKDDHLNLVIKKPATKGYELKPPVILQAHTDMVCEKNKGTLHNFDRDPINVEVEGDKVIAKETTLGADDGIGVALALALLADKEAEHPAVEIILTSDEERGLVGAEHFDMNRVEGRMLINLDANDEGSFVVGCAGGPVIRVEIPIERVQAVADTVTLSISVRGLTGGHSGEDIHRGRANSNKLMSRLLQAIRRETDLALASLSGGLQYNAIPRETEALITVNANDKQTVLNLILTYEKIYRNEYRSTEPTLEIVVLENKDRPANVLSTDSSGRLIDYLYLSDNGIIRMDAEIPGTVESSINLGTIRLQEHKAVIQVMTRSSVESVYREMYNRVAFLAKHAGGEIHIMADCPEWEYNPDSRLKQIFHEVYEEMFSIAPEFHILHAGLECGVFAKKSTKPLDMIAAGPTSRNLHTPGEYVSISSVQNFWRFLKEVLKHI